MYRLYRKMTINDHLYNNLATNMASALDPNNSVMKRLWYI